jgi:hypothetical protein
MRWYRKAADQGLAQAEMSLGWMYDSGQGVAQDYSEGRCQTKCRRFLAMVDLDHEQPVPIFQQLTRGHPLGRDDVREIPAFAAQRRGSAS